MRPPCRSECNLGAPLVNSCALVVSDESGDVQAFQRRLGEAWTIDRFCPPGDVASALGERQFDLILLDGRAKVSADSGFI